MGVVPTAIFMSSSKLSLYSPTLNKASCSNPAIQEYIPFELLVNPNIWHVKVSLVVFAMNNRYEFLPTCKTIIAPKLACDLEYMPWFGAPRHPRSKAAVEASPLSTPIQEPTPMAAPPPTMTHLTMMYNPLMFEASTESGTSLQPHVLRMEDTLSQSTTDEDIMIKAMRPIYSLNQEEI
ncbi:hypothetical protein Gotur_013576 [Gossypium turneri]